MNRSTCTIHGIRLAAGGAVIISTEQDLNLDTPLPVISKVQEEPKQALLVGDNLVVWRNLFGSMFVLAEGEDAIAELLATLDDLHFAGLAHKALEEAAADFNEVNSQSTVSRLPGRAKCTTQLSGSSVHKLAPAINAAAGRGSATQREVPDEFIELISAAA